MVHKYSEKRVFYIFKTLNCVQLIKQVTVIKELLKNNNRKEEAAATAQPYIT